MLVQVTDHRCPGHPHGPERAREEQTAVHEMAFPRTGMYVRPGRAGTDLADAATVLLFNLDRIAMDCGFSSHSHFSTVFRRALGTTPAEIRRDLLPA